MGQRIGTLPLPRRCAKRQSGNSCHIALGRGAEACSACGFTQDTGLDLLLSGQVTEHAVIVALGFKVKRRQPSP